jgi:16S rRNA (guanine527-N7)-methyltransferase
VERCGLGTRVTVVHGRAETIGHLDQFRRGFDAVVARSFGRPAITAECAAPFLREEGLLVVSEPPEDVTSDARWSPSGLDRLGLSASWLVRGDFGYRLTRQLRECPPEFSRRDGVPAKRPLF